MRVLLEFGCFCLLLISFLWVLSKCGSYSRGHSLEDLWYIKSMSKNSVDFYRDYSILEYELRFWGFRLGGPFLMIF